MFIPVNDADKPEALELARLFAGLGFDLVATTGTARMFRSAGLEAEDVLKVYEGRPNIVDRIKNGEVNLVVNTASGKRTVQDSASIRQTTLLYGVPYSTTLEGSKAIAMAIAAAKNKKPRVKSIQEYYAG